MDTIRNILKPGGATDNEILYGTGTSTHPTSRGNTGNLTGQGSHLSSATGTGPASGEGSFFSTARDTNTDATTSNSDNTTTTAGPYSSSLANKAEPRVDSNLDGSQTIGNTRTEYGSTGASYMPGGFPDESKPQNPYSSREVDPRLDGVSSNKTEGVSSSATTQSGMTDQNLAGNDYHYARDGAVLGGAAAVGEGVHHRREKEHAVGPQTVSNVNNPGGSTSTNTNTTMSTTGPHDSSILNKLDPRVKNDTAGADPQNSSYPDTAQSSAHHYGGDVAKLGGAAAVSEGNYHNRENEQANPASNSSNTGTSSSRVDPSYSAAPVETDISGPHNTTTANRLDPLVTQSGAPVDDVHQHHPQTGRGAEIADETHGNKKHSYGKGAAEVGATGVGVHELGKHHDDKQFEKDQGYSPIPGAAVGQGTTEPSSEYADKTKEHHYGTDVAGIGAAGVGAHELNEHHGKKSLEREQVDNSTTGTTADAATTTGQVGSGVDPTLTGPVHRSSLLNKLDPRVKRISPEATGVTTSSSTDSSTDHHHGRDALEVGAAGLGAHELNKHHDEKKFAREQGYGTTGTTAGALGGETQHDEHEKLKFEAARNQPGNDYGSDAYGNKASETKAHHYGPDTAGAGVVGAGAYEAEKHHSRNKNGKALEKDQKQEAKEEKKHSSGELLGFLHRDKNKKHDKEEEDEFDRQEHGNISQNGRNATLGVGAVGVGGHELDNIHKEKAFERNQAYDSVPGQMTGPTDQAREHHYGRDVAGAGAIGTAGYEAEKHHHGHQHTGGDTMKTLPVAPGNNGIGTGEGTQNALVIDRKRGEGYVDPLAGKPLGSDIGDKLHGPARNRGVDASTGYVSGTNQPAGDNLVTGQPGSHLGRDTAVGAGAGGVGAAAYEHQHNKHANSGPGQSNSSPTSGNYTTSGNPGYDNASSGYGGSQILRDSTPIAGTAYGGPGSISTSSHNKLHKNPPATHPAAQGGMTEDGRYIQPGTGRPMESGMPNDEGSQNSNSLIGSKEAQVQASGLRRDLKVGEGVQGVSGVANPRGENNLSTNY